MISLQTNVTSLMAQQNLNADNKFQSNTIAQLTSGYRINSSGDDAAGLAIANGYRSNIAELSQGIRNANDGVSQLQILDGGLSNISTILDRMKTLATQSASSSFTGSRATLNQEYSQLISEVNRQAANINLNAGGSFNNPLSVYIGGATQASNATISVDLSGSQSAVDATSLGLNATNVLGGGVGVTGNTLRIDANSALFLKSATPGDNQTFTFNVFANGSAQKITATVPATANGSTLSSVLSTLNGQLNIYGIEASTDNNGELQFSGSTAFTLVSDTTTGASAQATELTSTGTAGTGTATNTSNYNSNQTFTSPLVGTQVLKFQTGAGSATVTLSSGDTLSAAIAEINAVTSTLGVYAVQNAAGTGISLQSSTSFSLNAAAPGAAGGVAAAYTTATAPTAGTTSNANSAITALDAAVQAIGLVQGRVGAGENLLQYSINLAQSQISSFSAAQSQIRDADVAAQAANLTKAQILTQTSVAALAQANSQPQSVLKLLQG